MVCILSLAGCGGGGGDSKAPPPDGGVNFWAINTKTDTMYSLKADLIGEGEHCYIYLERNGRKTSAPDVPSIIHQFDNVIYPKLRAAYGEEPDVDNDPKVYLLLLDIIDDWNGTTVQAYYAGYFFSMDQDTSWHYSNKRDIIYLDIYPGNPNPLSDINRFNTFRSCMAHEFQHMIYWHKTGGVSINDTWLNEAMSELASFYAFDEPSWSRVASFVSYDPTYNITRHSDSLTDWGPNNNLIATLADYDVVYMWAQYIADRFDNKVLDHYAFRSILDNTATSGRGKVSVQSYLDSLNQGLTFASVFRDWANAVFFGNNDGGNPVSTDCTLWTYKTINTWPGSYGGYSVHGLFNPAAKYDSIGRYINNYHGNLNNYGLRQLRPWSLGYYWKTSVPTPGSVTWTQPVGGSLNLYASLFYNEFPTDLDKFEPDMISENTYTYNGTAYMFLQNAQDAPAADPGMSSSIESFLGSAQPQTPPTFGAKLHAFSQNVAAPTRGAAAEPMPVCMHDILSRQAEKIQLQMLENRDTH